MPIDGTWKITIKATVLPPIDGTLILETEGDMLSGSSITSFGTSEFTGGKVDGNEIEFSVDASTPFGESKLVVKGTVDGDELKGQAVMQPAGMKAKVTGKRESP
jgi:hypothetical protein